MTQAEHKEWVDRMFPNQPVYMPVMGMVEEAAELFRAVLKQDQEKVYGKEPRFVDKDWYAEQIDAIGDCTIYCCSFCNAAGWKFDELLHDAQGYVPKHCTILRTLQDLISTANLLIIDKFQGYVVRYLSNLKVLAKLLSIDFDVAVQITWEKVRERCRT